MELQSCENPQKYYDIVHYGCLHNTTYDMQCEGNRGWYLHQAANCVGGASILKANIERYAQSFTDYWLFEQLTSVLYHFAADGSKDARMALYDKYEILIDILSHMNMARQNSVCDKRDMFDMLCEWIVLLDGWHAFKKIVNEVSERLIPRDDYFFSEEFYDIAKNKFGKKRVELYLTKQSEKSQFIRRYLHHAQERDHRKLEVGHIPTLEEVIEGVNGERFQGRGLSMYFAKNASLDDLEKLFFTAMAETDLLKRAELIWGLRSAKCSIPEAFINELLESENEDIRDTAFYIMGKTPSPKMREYALMLMERGEDDINAISLLSENLTKSDENLFCMRIKSIPVKFNEGA